MRRFIANPLSLRGQLLPRVVLANTRRPSTDLDHQSIAVAQGLYTISPLTPGSVFLLPHGTRIFNKLLAFMRKQYSLYGYEEVISPIIYKKTLWEQSGHWENYAEDMFSVTGRGAEGEAAKAKQEGRYLEDEEYGLKPMNCPGHCLIYASDDRSYRDLPIRYADFSPLHRNEASGALQGLTRVRRFHQDDAHIFCTPAQIASEIADTLRFVHAVFTVFQLPSYELFLSTRPEKYIGELAEWEQAEGALKEALNTTGREWAVKEGDGAFYGPKIDIVLKDAAGRRHQTATIQLDFQLPHRFNLKYRDAGGEIKTPVIVHRAILGSVERTMAILMEHTGGKWPFWLSPRQATVVPATTAPEVIAYAEAVQRRLSGVVNTLTTATEPPSPTLEMATRTFFVDIDASEGKTLGKRVREAQKRRVNFTLVVGQKEMVNGTVAVRSRDGKQLGEKTVEEVYQMFLELEKTYQ
ncbi:hypothetical protein YB2330_002916 [Saitoella coloradoensis]